MSSPLAVSLLLLGWFSAAAAAASVTASSPNKIAQGRRTVEVQTMAAGAQRVRKGADHISSNLQQQPPMPHIRREKNLSPREALLESTAETAKGFPSIPIPGAGGAGSQETGHGYTCFHLCNRAHKPEKYLNGQSDYEVQRVKHERDDGTCDPFWDGQYELPPDSYDPKCGDDARCEGVNEEYGPYGLCVCTDLVTNCTLPGQSRGSLMEKVAVQEAGPDDTQAENNGVATLSGRNIASVLVASVVAWAPFLGGYDF